MEFNSYAIFQVKKVEILPIVNFQFKILLGKVHRRLSIRQTIRNPWKVVVVESIHRNIILEWFKAVRDHSTRFGRCTEEKRDKKGVLTELFIKFIDIRSFVFHFSKAIDFTNRSAKFYTTKKIRGCKIRVTASEEHPIIFHFHVRRSKVTLTLHYEVKNRYGNVMLS
jgi:hypothetical protein